MSLKRTMLDGLRTFRLREIVRRIGIDPDRIFPVGGHPWDAAAPTEADQQWIEARSRSAAREAFESYAKAHEESVQLLDELLARRRGWRAVLKLRQLERLRGVRKVKEWLLRP